MNTFKLILLLFVTPLTSACTSNSNPFQRILAKQDRLTINGISYQTRAYWMRQANLALVHPCPFGAFGSVIVNHTARNGLGELVCTGRNAVRVGANPVMHGETAAITNCSQILTSPDGPYRLSPSKALAAFADLSLYTNAEPCPMCASAIRWAGFKELVFGTSIDELVEKGWSQIRINSVEVFERSWDLPSWTKAIGGILTNETSKWFEWQFDEDAECPSGCRRVQDGEMGCRPMES
ncbi:cytidine deaminase-like protein [Podospora fimiseda]|uniref:Cytidine deaminase-like protein n=1 Tax=Podospora fimiseda TaxID=252190 RepID=A0AAN7BPL0_9PEZI|nr:cytidine deaminase-like protein [Podospora fimiseda]